MYVWVFMYVTSTDAIHAHSCIMSCHHTYGLTVIGGVVFVFQFVLSSRRSLLEVAFYHVITSGGGSFHVHRATVVTLLTRFNALNFRLVEASSYAVEVKKPVG